VSEDQVSHDLDQMTGDPALTEQLKASLERLRDGAAGPVLAEMAAEILDGRTTLREVARSSAYETEMTNVMAGFQQWNASLSNEEREQLAADATSDDRTRPDR